MTRHEIVTYELQKLFLLKRNVI